MLLGLLMFSSSLFAWKGPGDHPFVDQLRLGELEERVTSIEKKLDEIILLMEIYQKNPEELEGMEENNIINGSSSQKEEMLTGMVFKVRHGDSEKSNWIEKGVSSEHFAGFISNSYEVSTDDIYQKTLGYRGPYALNVEGFFKAEEKGVYNFGVMHKREKKTGKYSTIKCVSHVSLNGSILDESSKKIVRYEREHNMLINGSVSLEPGIYEYAVYSVCEDQRENGNVIRSFLVKTPRDLSMRLFKKGEILHKK
jgi:hypothetical protein